MESITSAILHQMYQRRTQVRSHTEGECFLLSSLPPNSTAMTRIKTCTTYKKTRFTGILRGCMVTGLFQKVGPLRPSALPSNSIRSHLRVTGQSSVDLALGRARNSVHVMWAEGWRPHQQNASPTTLRACQVLGATSMASTRNANRPCRVTP